MAIRRATAATATKPVYHPQRISTARIATVTTTGQRPERADSSVGARPNVSLAAGRWWRTATATAADEPTRRQPAHGHPTKSPRSGANSFFGRHVRTATTKHRPTTSGGSGAVPRTRAGSIGERKRKWKRQRKQPPVIPLNQKTFNIQLRTSNGS